MFIANLVGISLTRELAPLMVAILVAGRSGSAFAAEIGTMKVSEEIDALTTMGFDKLEFLVMPRVLSVTLAMPFLVIICNVVGMIGGMIAAVTTLDITMAGYIGRMQMAISLWDIGTGLIKSIMFGFLIASLGCYKGINVKGGADAVGRYTTASVVAGVFLIIVTDAVFTFIFQALGI
jgi:phospholipid/cholesterol/gamma-HCH transport system permease protein